MNSTDFNGFPIEPLDEFDYFDEFDEFDQFMEEQSKFENIISASSELVEIESEDDLSKSDKKLLISHNTSFEQLLQDYVDAAKYNQKYKRGMKIAFFVITMSVVVLLNVSFVFISIWGIWMQKNPQVDMVDILPPIIASFASVITSIITIPKVIATYLFDKTEDVHLSSMISEMQKYDTSIRNTKH